ncbi:DNA-directed RNA polymerase II subunit RPB2 [Acrasis kona]|uniref:DNA-directed RNA polymerase II subunit RPB2 n=1 Tax=Acrasis kona TaxID=1008807 RepID=A0AAW2ZBQ2_9EUKA
MVSTRYFRIRMGSKNGGIEKHRVTGIRFDNDRSHLQKSQVEPVVGAEGDDIIVGAFVTITEIDQDITKSWQKVHSRM